MTVHVNDNGTLRSISGIYVNDNGTLRTITAGYVNDNGTLRQFFAGVRLPATITIDHHETTPTDSYAAISFKQDGTYWDVSGQTGTTLGNQQGTWLLGGDATDYEIMAHLESGTAVAAGGNVSAQDTWLAIGATPRIWAASRTSNIGDTSTTAVFTVQIRLAATSSVVASTTLTLTASIDAA